MGLLSVRGQNRFNDCPLAQENCEKDSTMEESKHTCSLASNKTNAQGKKQTASYSLLSALTWRLKHFENDEAFCV